MKIGIVGTGYVGLVQGAVLADFGLKVICMDIDDKKISMLNEGKIPIYEPGLKELIDKVDSRLEFTRDIKYTVQNSDVIFIAVPTPSMTDGSVDLHYVLEVAKEIGSYMNNYKVVVNKSTVPIGTGKKVKEIIKQELEDRKMKINFDIVANPEFLREGKAIGDSTHPDRVVIGTESDKAKELMKKVYDVLYLKETPFVFTNIETAEMIKYASNAFLATKISYINEIALLSEKVGANVQEIAKAMGMDGRISKYYLNAGPGYGGSCLPKDTRAIVDIAKKYDVELKVIQAGIDANKKQKIKMVEKIEEKVAHLEGRTIGILGLSFKPETDDMREAPSIDIIRGLVHKGVKIKAFCPEGMKEAKWRLKDIEKQIIYCNDAYDVAKESDAIVLITEWNQFRGLDLKRIKSLMKDEYFFDLRNVYSNDKNVRMLFNYFPIGLS